MNTDLVKGLYRVLHPTAQKEVLYCLLPGTIFVIGFGYGRWLDVTHQFLTQPELTDVLRLIILAVAVLVSGYIARVLGALFAVFWLIVIAVYVHWETPTSQKPPDPKEEKFLGTSSLWRRTAARFLGWPYDGTQQSWTAPSGEVSDRGREMATELLRRTEAGASQAELQEYVNVSSREIGILAGLEIARTTPIDREWTMVYETVQGLLSENMARSTMDHVVSYFALAVVGFVLAWNITWMAGVAWISVFLVLSGLLRCWLILENIPTRKLSSEQMQVIALLKLLGERQSEEQTHGVD